jgi:hypothetical protein
VASENLPAVVPARGIVDERGLSENQRRFLLEIAAGKTRREAAKAIGVTYPTVQVWQRLPVFRTALAECFDGTIAETRIRMGGATATAMDGLLEAMDAMRDVEVKLNCPDCGAELVATAKVPNWTARVKAYEMVLKAAKILKDVKEIEGSITTMTMEQKIAMMLFKAEKYDQIPSYMWAELQRLRVIPDDMSQPLDAQYEVRES